MIETFLFVRLGEVCSNVAWKLQKCCEMWEEVMWPKHEAKLHILGKKDLESLSRLSSNEFRLVTNKRLGYDMPWVKLKMICTALFWIDSNCSVCTHV